MALVKFGGGVVGMSGSIAGNTFARNRYGSYVRARTKPVNPNSAMQQLVRNALNNATTRWNNTLTAAQRTAWNLYGASVVMQNKLGENINLSGFNHYVRSNSTLIREGHTPVDAGPTSFSLPDADGTFAISVSEATNLIVITFDDTAAWCDLADAYMFVYCGSPQNAAINFFAGPWKLAGSLDGSVGSPPSTGDSIAAPFVLTEGQHVWAYARIALPDGRLSSPFRSDCAVAA